MGLSSRQVISSDGHAWNNNNNSTNNNTTTTNNNININISNNNKGILEGGNMEVKKPCSLMKRKLSNDEKQGEQLKCPRCDSSNTKFCYYNNYNKSQPRHFCKACKRHWTKGGTLRNVPAGGGRKNKRLKTSTKTTTPTTLYGGVGSYNYNNTTVQPPLGLPLTTVVGDDSNFSEAFYQKMLCSSTLSLFQNDEIDPQFEYSNLGIFESDPCSISSNYQSPNVYNFTGEGVNVFEETGVNTSLSSSSISDHYQNWENPTSCNLGWDYFDKFMSVEDDLTLPWNDDDDDAEIKP